MGQLENYQSLNGLNRLPKGLKGLKKKEIHLNWTPKNMSKSNPVHLWRFVWSHKGCNLYPKMEKIRKILFDVAPIVTWCFWVLGDMTFLDKAPKGPSEIFVFVGSGPSGPFLSDVMFLSFKWNDIFEKGPSGPLLSDVMFLGFEWNGIFEKGPLGPQLVTSLTLLDRFLSDMTFLNQKIALAPMEVLLSHKFLSRNDVLKL